MLEQAAPATYNATIHALFDAADMNIRIAQCADAQLVIVNLSTAPGADANLRWQHLSEYASESVHHFLPLMVVKKKGIRSPVYAHASVLRPPVPTPPCID